MVLVEEPISQNTGNPVNWDQYWIRSYYYSGLNGSGSYATSTKGWWGYNLAQTYGGICQRTMGYFWYQSSPFTNYGLRTYILEVHQIDVKNRSGRCLTQQTLSRTPMIGDLNGTIRRSILSGEYRPIIIDMQFSLIAVNGAGINSDGNGKPQIHTGMVLMVMTIELILEMDGYTHLPPQCIGVDSATG